MSALWFATPGMTAGIGWVIAALIVANLAFEFSAVFCNAMLTSIAPPGGIGRLSGFGFAAGNFVGILCSCSSSMRGYGNPHPLFGLSLAAHEPERAVGFIAALSLAFLGLPVFFLAPDAPGTSVGVVAAIARGARALGHTIVKVREYRNIVLFLLARVAFNEGFVVMVIFTGVFAAGILHWTADMVILQGIFNSITAVLGALIAGWMDARFGSKRSTMVFLGPHHAAQRDLAVAGARPDVLPRRLAAARSGRPVSDLARRGVLRHPVADRVFRHRRLRDLARPDGEAVARRP